MVHCSEVHVGAGFPIIVHTVVTSLLQQNTNRTRHITSEYPGLRRPDQFSCSAILLSCADNLLIILPYDIACGVLSNHFVLVFRCHRCCALRCQVEPSCVVLCCVVLCCVVLCCVVLCCVVLCCVVLCCVVLCCVVLCCVVLCCVVLRCVALCCVVLCQDNRSKVRESPIRFLLCPSTLQRSFQPKRRAATNV